MEKRLTACNESLAEIGTRGGNFQGGGDCFSSMIFVVVLISLSIILNEINFGGLTNRNQKLNALLFLDNLKILQRVRGIWIRLSRP